MTNWQKNMIELGTHWMEHYDEDSKREGWALFNHDGTLQIQALDDPEEGQATLKGGDGEAYTLCCNKALNGSKLHLLALFLDGRPVNEDGVDVPKILLK